MCFSIAFIETTPKSYVENYKPLTQVQNYSDTSFPAYYFVSAFEYPLLPIVTREKIQNSRWGLIPHWVKDAEQAAKIRTMTLNAKAETLFEKPSFKKSSSLNRCILGISGFFEWRDFNNRKIPYFISLKNSEWMSLACIFDEWIDVLTGEVLNTFSIVTTSANSLMQKIHNTKQRMPLILTKENEKKWIDTSLTIAEIKKLMIPYPEEKMKAYTVSTFINSSQNNRNIPEAIFPVVYEGLD